MAGKPRAGRGSRERAAGRFAAGLRSGTAARLLSRLSALNLVEGSVRLAAQAFLTALPLLMTVGRRRTSAGVHLPHTLTRRG
ncbi:hypothetical protein [Streptomyces lavendulocolor]|uniref:hypothetical protein n=1 Tax=Streptomyces lavendulocolor TaxID=67316 RepID=UPI003C2F7FC9